MSRSGLSRLALDDSTNTIFFSFLLQLFINLNTGQEVLTALGVFDVLNTDIDPK